MDLNQLYSQVILEHYENSPHRREMEGDHICERGYNPLCGDDITLQVKFNRNIIEDVAFKGKGCAISQASTSMLIDLIKGRNVEEVLELIDEFLKMIKKEDGDYEILEDAQILQGVSDFPARIKCAVLAWHTLKNIIVKQYEMSK
ncbi:SUF system NifU family Fe-S cluster assembly protein [Alkaliphilus sp. MSJ-5]|uniref:SUF system NifU family Fe-S cluster assembly protein n=1 Tax=Alkaliphilus flagellatus TaxID=2841507 RepID=A0ABS6G0Q4_9FIRM|nr:SUF system NifU family Fe-S cluster assembly protein [Alkaliphilus flagellatus]MBU5676070.1 SUF system NifU family Fe-S cluster assembly protein [Alkaliphilus flagellatus]